MEGLTRVTRVRVSTPFGPPSDAIVVGDLEGVRVAFLARHGRGHRLSPSEINYRANIYALKKLGVERVVSVSAVGSMKETLHPGHVVIPHQFYDQTKRRIGTFFERGLVAHVALADPVCRDEAGKLAEAARKCGATVHEGGVYLCIEGPQFSTRGESLIYRQWGVDVIGMTNLPEAKLAREAQLCYATLALVTDYDCWHPGHDAVTVDAIIETLHRNVALSRQVIQTVAPTLTGDRPCSCARALETAVLALRVAPRAQRVADPPSAVARLRYLPSPGPGRLPVAGPALPGQHRSGVAAHRPAAGEAARIGGLPHYELLDRAQALAALSSPQ